MEVDPERSRPKSGREKVVVFIPQKVAARLKGYIRDKGITPEERIFPIGYAAARIIVRNASRQCRVVEYIRGQIP